MANEYILQDLIDQYIKGELSGEALDKFKNKLRDDQDFSRKVELQQLLINQIQAERNAELKEYIAQNSKVEYIQNIWGKKWMYASAAIVTLAAGLYFALQRMESIPEIVSNEKADTEQVEAEAVESEEDAALSFSDSSHQAESPAVDQDGAVIAQVEDSSIPETNDDVVTLSELSEEERKIASNDSEHVLKDSLLSTKSYPIVYVVLENDKSFAEVKLKDSQDTIAVEVEEKRENRLFGRRKKSDTRDRGTEADSLGVNAMTQANDIEDVVEIKRVKVQYWKSVVSFKGYRYTEGTVQLYGIDTNSKLTFKNYQDSLYINISGTYFALVGNGHFNKYVKVTDAALLKVLSR
jgi:hypothetical protein